MSVYDFIPASATEVPVLISVPHCGTLFPDELAQEYEPGLINFPDDTDWFVDRLYDFAPRMGMAMITAKYSRWVIDLNRDPNSKPLYTDGRVITALCPTTTFLGTPLYKDKRGEVTPGEIQRRLDLYYRPYHDRIRSELGALKKKFGKILLWDCHSIRQVVASIHKEKFPDLIVGDVDGTSAERSLTDIAIANLGSSSNSLAHNYPFKGGYITRYFGKPVDNQHALQLEMTKLNYMDDTETKYDPLRAAAIKKLLQGTFEKLIVQLT